MGDNYCTRIQDPNEYGSCNSPCGEGRIILHIVGNTIDIGRASAENRDLSAIAQAARGTVEPFRDMGRLVRSGVVMWIHPPVDNPYSRKL